MEAGVEIGDDGEGYPHGFQGREDGFRFREKPPCGAGGVVGEKLFEGILHGRRVGADAG